MSLPEDVPAIDRLLAEARRGLERVEAASLAAEVEAGALVVDIRPSEQRSRDGELPGALVVDRNVLEWRLDPSSPHCLPEADAEARVIVVCNEGYQSSLAAANLQRLGVRARHGPRRGLPGVAGSLNGSVSHARNLFCLPAQETSCGQRQEPVLGQPIPRTRRKYAAVCRGRDRSAQTNRPQP